MRLISVVVLSAFAVCLIMGLVANQFQIAFCIMALGLFCDRRGDGRPHWLF